MATRKSRKPRDLPKEPSVDSSPDVQLIIQRHLITFMGRRFPEFCILRAACRVSVKASPSATGDNRVASYQAAINAVAARHYADWPFMVEVLNKWLEMNQDFVRDPLGYVASNSPPGPASPTPDDHLPVISTTHDTPSRTATSGHRITQIPSTAMDDIDANAFEHAAGPSLAASKIGTEANDLGGPPSPLNSERDVPMPIQKLLPLSWIGVLHFLPILSSLGVGPLTSRNTPSSSRGWLTARVPSTHQISNSPKTCWLRLSFVADLYRGWWNVLKKTFAI